MPCLVPIQLLVASVHACNCLTYSKWCMQQYISQLLHGRNLKGIVMTTCANHTFLLSPYLIVHAPIIILVSSPDCFKMVWARNYHNAVNTYLVFSEGEYSMLSSAIVALEPGLEERLAVGNLCLCSRVLVAFLTVFSSAWSMTFGW